jgi:hypothetical protein
MFNSQLASAIDRMALSLMNVMVVAGLPLVALSVFIQAR